ncbi:MAG: methyltransferase [Bacteroidales bacterium]|jgi:tRNA1Val (adenine37-N6)-methyltransferase|nr:methyltransferase [Bacteroidales bacterium]
MSNSYFRFKQFTIHQDKASFKVGTDSVILGAWVDTGGAESILDIGTGTGLLALMLAQRSGALITAIEPDRDSFEQAYNNVKNCKWHERICVVNTTLQDFSSGSGMYDLIVTNPPYFSGSLKNPDSRKAASRHNDSLQPSDLLKAVDMLLHEDGSFYIILPYAEAAVFIAEASDYGFFCNSMLKIKPSPSGSVIRLIMSLSRSAQRLSESFLTIGKGPRHEYTADYINLTKDFYPGF